MTTNRRSFLKQSALAGSTLAATRFASARTEQKKYRAAIIGRTGGGNYGHSYDKIFNDLPNVTVEAVADHDRKGAQEAAKRSGAKRIYQDYREMLKKEKPDLVCIASRQPDCHKEMLLAAIESGTHIFMEKPFTETPQQADEVIAAAEAKKIKIGIAHTRRYTDDFTYVKALIQQGFIGRTLDVHINGKQDNRSGGEDLIVLGTHDFDIMRYYFGDPLWCFATVLQDGEPITKEDARHGNEPITVAGDTIRAMMMFPNTIACTWSSTKSDDHWNSHFGGREKWRFEIYGTKRIISHQSSYGTYYLDSPFPAHQDEKALWKPIPEPESWNPPEYATHPIRDLIHSIETDTQPICSAYDGRWTIDMLSAVYQSSLSHQPVHFPLKNRVHPLY